MTAKEFGDAGLLKTVVEQRFRVFRSRSTGLDRDVSDNVNVDELHFRREFVEFCAAALCYRKFVVRLCVLRRVKKDDLHQAALLGPVAADNRSTCERFPASLLCVFVEKTNGFGTSSISNDMICTNAMATL